jgi:hypothetical protein
MNDQLKVTKTRSIFVVAKEQSWFHQRFPECFAVTAAYDRVSLAMDPPNSASGKISDFNNCRLSSEWKNAEQWLKKHGSKNSKPLVLPGSVGLKALH